MAGATLYDWKAGGRVSDWLLEGRGEVITCADGALCLRTHDCGPGRRASNAWLSRIELPEAFSAEWTFQSRAADGNVMVIFNARSLGLRHLFEDPRPDARYCDLASYGKMACYTIGFHRAVYGRPSVLRKLGGAVPPEWGQMDFQGPLSQAMQQQTTLHSTQEPLFAADRGREHVFRLERLGALIRFWVNGALVHDLRDTGQYRYYPEPLLGGCLGFRNFGGFADDCYAALVIRDESNPTIQG